MLCGERSQNEIEDILRNSLGENKQFGGERKGKEMEKKEKKKRKTKSVCGKEEKERRKKGESQTCTLRFPMF